MRSAVTMLILLGLSGAAGADEVIEFGRLGKVTLYMPAGEPKQLVLFLSGDGGWNLGVVDMAKHLSNRGAMVAGIDINQYKKRLLESADSCLYPPGDLESFAHHLESKYRFPGYLNPILVGYSSGATLAYTTLVQSPAGTFKGALSLGFCPDLPWQKPMCAGSGPGLKADPAPKQGQKEGQGYIFRTAPGLKDYWAVMQGDIDQVCDKSLTEKFAAEIPAADFILLPKVGHGYSVERNYLPQYLAAYDKLAAVPAPVATILPTSVSDLPLVEVPASGTAAPFGDLMAVILTGDGGWAGLDREVAAVLAGRGIPVIGWDSLRYFWTAKNPEIASKDLDRIIRHYSASWQKSRVLLVGYSMGADAMPFLLNRLPPDTRSKVAATSLLGLGTEAFFEFHVGLWVGRTTGGQPVEPEMRRLEGSNITCIFGKDESDSLCRKLPDRIVHRTELGGGHHFGGDYEHLAQLILSGIPARPGG